MLGVERSLKFALVLAPCLLLVTEAQAQTAVTFSLDSGALGRHAAWFVAIDKGYYKKAGLDVTIVPGDGPAQAIQSLESRASQFAFSDVASLVAARAKSQAGAKMVAVIYQKAPYAIFSLRSGANVSKPEQLENLVIGTSNDSANRKVIEAFMSSRGLKADTVKYTNIDSASAAGALAAKQLPAIESSAMWLPEVIKAAGAQDTQMFLLANSGLSLYSNGILVREDYLKNNTAQVKGFVRASLEGWRDAIANPKEAAEIVAKHVKGLDPASAFQEVAVVNGLVATPETRAKGLGTMDGKQMDASVALAAKAAGAEGKIAAKDVYDTSALPQPPVKP
jgi:NitT/TauT family transport system substrate-binding protein